MKPNIVYIYADDLGRGMLSCYGQKHFRTPNIDRLAESGVRCMRSYGTAFCAPARSCLFAGIHDAHSGRWSMTGAGIYHELTSGAIRNHNPEIMYKAFEIAGYSKEEVDKSFGHMIRAFEYGAPPHGGNAPGIDRLLMVLNDWNSIRDIYAFPKDGKGKDVLMNAPAAVDAKLLRNLGIRIRNV